MGLTSVITSTTSILQTSLSAKASSSPNFINTLTLAFAAYALRTLLGDSPLIPSLNYIPPHLPIPIDASTLIPLFAPEAPMSPLPPSPTVTRSPTPTVPLAAPLPVSLSVLLLLVNRLTPILGSVLGAGIIYIRTKRGSIFTASQPPRKPSDDQRRQPPPSKSQDNKDDNSNGANNDGDNNDGDDDDDVDYTPNEDEDEAEEDDEDDEDTIDEEEIEALLLEAEEQVYSRFTDHAPPSGDPSGDPSPDDSGDFDDGEFENRPAASTAGFHFVLLATALAYLVRWAMLLPTTFPSHYDPIKSKFLEVCKNRLTALSESFNKLRARRLDMSLPTVFLFDDLALQGFSATTMAPSILDHSLEVLHAAELSVVVAASGLGNFEEIEAIPEPMCASQSDDSREELEQTNGDYVSMPITTPILILEPPANIVSANITKRLDWGTIMRAYIGWSVVALLLWKVYNACQLRRTMVVPVMLVNDHDDNFEARIMANEDIDTLATNHDDDMVFNTTSSSTSTLLPSANDEHESFKELPSADFDTTLIVDSSFTSFTSPNNINDGQESIEIEETPAADFDTGFFISSSTSSSLSELCHDNAEHERNEVEDESFQFIRDEFDTHDVFSIPLIIITPPNSLEDFFEGNTTLPVEGDSGLLWNDDDVEYETNIGDTEGERLMEANYDYEVPEIPSYPERQSVPGPEPELESVPVSGNTYTSPIAPEPEPVPAESDGDSTIDPEAIQAGLLALRRIVKGEEEKVNRKRRESYKRDLPRELQNTPETKQSKRHSSKKGKQKEQAPSSVSSSPPQVNASYVGPFARMKQKQRQEATLASGSGSAGVVPESSKAAINKWLSESSGEG